MKQGLFTSAVSLVVFGLALFSFTKHHLKEPADIQMAFQPGRGAHALPAAIQEMASMAATRNIPSFRLSSTLNNDVLTYQRSIEYLYPTRISEHARFVFSTRSETISTNCVLIQIGIHIALHDCLPQPQ